MGREEVQNGYTVMENETAGQIQISNEVITIIAGLAATEVKGVTSMGGNITNELVSKLGVRNLARGVRTTIENGVVRVELTLNLGYGANIPKTCQKVQEKVKASIENMTGLTVENVNIQIAAVKMDEGN